MSSISILVFATLATAVPVLAAEYLPVCEKCLNPRILSKSGAGTSAASAEAKVVQEDAIAWCATNRPRDPYCAREEVNNGGDGGRKSYKGAADCSAGVLHSIDGYDYQYAGVWPDGPGQGRPMLKDTGGNIRRWNSVVSGYGIARAEWHKFGGYSLTGQWEALCGKSAPAAVVQTRATTADPVSPALIAPAAAVSARPAPQAPASAAAPAAAVCTGKRYCSESTAFAAIVRDFRTSTLPDSTRLVSATIRFLNKTNRPLVLGYIRSAGVAADERGNRYTLPSAESVRGIGEIGGREFDPKFTVPPGQTADTRFEFVWRWNGRDIIGEKAWDLELAIREANEVARGQYRFGTEHVLQFRAVSPAIPAVSEAAPSPAVAPAAPAPPAAPAAAAAAEPARPDVCAGKRGCFDSGAFVAQIQHSTLTREGTYQDRVVRLNIQIRNTSQQPLSLAYVAKSSVLTDNNGNRFFWGTAGTYDMSATGIGKVEGGKADPQFTLAPGESRMATFTLRRRTAKSDPDGSTYTYNVTLAQVDVINQQQVRTAREHSLTFPDFALNASAASGSTAAPPAQQSIRDLTNTIRGLGKKKL